MPPSVRASAAGFQGWRVAVSGALRRQGAPQHPGGKGFLHQQGLTPAVEHRPTHPCRRAVGLGRRAWPRGGGPRLRPIAAHHGSAWRVPLQAPGTQGRAAHRPIGEQQFGQRTVAQAAHGAPGATGGTDWRHAAGPHGRLAIDPQQDFADMAVGHAQQVLLDGLQRLVTLPQLVDRHLAQAAQAGGQRAGGVQPMARGADRLTARTPRQPGSALGGRSLGRSGATARTGR